jgi:hypothetical protein
VQHKQRDRRVQWRTLVVWESQMGCSACSRLMLDLTATGRPGYTKEEHSPALCSAPVPATTGMVAAVLGSLS